MLRKNCPTAVLLQTLAICMPFRAERCPGHARSGQFESNDHYAAANHIDTLVMPTLRKGRIQPANLCSDAVLIRRAHLDVISSLPEPQEVRRFFQDRRSDKRTVLIDALCWISATRESYSSPIPEPFTFIPEENRTLDLADGSITSQFLETFGRPCGDRWPTTEVQDVC